MALSVGAVAPAGARTLACPVRRASSGGLIHLSPRNACTAPAHSRRPVIRNAVSREALVEEAEIRVEGSSGAPVASTSSSSKWTIDEDELLTSTWEHRAWVFGTSTLLLSTAVKGVWDVHDFGTGIGAGFALLSAYVLADLGTGIYHWAVDNYGSGDTPVFGNQIAGFQGHHVKPWTITQREFCNNVHKVFRPAFLPSLGLALSAGESSPAWNVGMSVFILLACMSQQFHAWSHMKKSELPAAIIVLQDMGILISRKAHGAHHRAPFEGNYCIVSGLWNPALDQDGADDAFFRRLERLVADKTGVEPRCWYEPEYDWMPEEEPETA